MPTSKLDDVGGEPLRILVSRRNAPLGGPMLPKHAARSGAPTVSTRFERGRCRRGGARGSEISPGGFRQDHLIERQIGHRLAKPCILRLKFLQALHLIRLQPAELLAPANGMDGSPFRPQAESLQLEGEPR